MALEELAVKLVCRKITEEQLNAIRQREEIFRKSLYGDDVAAAHRQYGVPRCDLCGDRQQPSRTDSE